LTQVGSLADQVTVNTEPPGAGALARGDPLVGLCEGRTRASAAVQGDRPTNCQVNTPPILAFSACGRSASAEPGASGCDFVLVLVHPDTASCKPDPLGLQPQSLLHSCEAWQADPTAGPQHAVPWQARGPPRPAERPRHLASGAGEAGRGGHLPIAGDSTPRNPADYRPHRPEIGPWMLRAITTRHGRSSGGVRSRPAGAPRRRRQRAWAAPPGCFR